MARKNGIGTISEWSLHSDIKRSYMTADSREEVDVDGFIVDVVRDDLLIEVQTRGFSKIRDKLMKLVKSHRVRLVYPVSLTKWIVRESPEGSETISRRRSPKQQGPQSLFDELVSIPTLLHHQNFSLEVLLIEEEEIRRKDNQGSWRRRGWSIIDRRLLGILGRRVYNEPKDLLHFIPDSLKDEFTNRELADATGYTIREAGKVTYCLRRMGILIVTGKRGNANVFSVKRDH